MKTGELTQKLAEMQKATEAGRLQWRVDIQGMDGRRVLCVLPLSVPGSGFWHDYV